MLYSEERCFPRQVHEMRNKFALKCERACLYCIYEMIQIARYGKIKHSCQITNYIFNLILSVRTELNYFIRLCVLCVYQTNLGLPLRFQDLIPKKISMLLGAQRNDIRDIFISLLIFRIRLREFSIVKAFISFSH